MNDYQSIMIEKLLGGRRYMNNEVLVIQMIDPRALLIENS